MKTLLRVLGIVLGVAVVLAIVAIVAIYFVSERRIDRRYEVAAEDVAVPDDAGAIERGKVPRAWQGLCAVDSGGEPREPDATS